MSALVRGALAAMVLVVLVGCGGGSDQAQPFPFPATSAQQQPQQVVEPSPVASADGADPSSDRITPDASSTPTDFCSAWQAMTAAGYRYASQHIAVGADELIATTDAARALLPASAPAFSAQQIEVFAYQGQAGLLARDMSGDALASFQRDIDRRFRDDALALPARVEDFLWVSNYCPDLPDPKRYFEAAAGLIVSEPITITAPAGRGSVTLANHPISFDGDPTLVNEAQGGGYVGRRTEPDGTSSALTVTRQTDVHPEEWAFGECSFAGDAAAWAAEQDRVLYLEPTDNGTTVVITFRPQLSDLAPAIFSLSLVSTEQAPTELGQAGLCVGDLAVWDGAARNRYVVTGEFYDSTPRDSVDYGFPRAFYSIAELMAAPGADEMMHAMRTMTFDLET